MKKKFKFNIFILIIIICFIISIFILNILSKKVLPIFMDYAVSEIKLKTTVLINDAVSEEISNISDLDELIFITKNNDNDIQMIDFNSSYVNKILNSITNKLLNKIKNVENNNKFPYFDNSIINKYNKGIVYQVPLGVISNNVFLGNLGPKIPLKLNTIGDVFTNINTGIKEYGINNALVEISVNVSVNQKVLIPFLSENINISLSIPISLKLIQGNIPIYYGSGFQKNSNILSTSSE